jgi:hypothetical protein
VLSTPLVDLILDGADEDQWIAWSVETNPVRPLHHADPDAAAQILCPIAEDGTLCVPDYVKINPWNRVEVETWAHPTRTLRAHSSRDRFYADATTETVWVYHAPQVTQVQSYRWKPVMSWTPPNQDETINSMLWSPAHDRLFLTTTSLYNNGDRERVLRRVVLDVENQTRTEYAYGAAPWLRYFLPCECECGRVRPGSVLDDHVWTGDGAFVILSAADGKTCRDPRYRCLVLDIKTTETHDPFRGLGLQNTERERERGAMCAGAAPTGSHFVAWVTSAETSGWELALMEATASGSRLLQVLALPGSLTDAVHEKRYAVEWSDSGRHVLVSIEYEQQHVSLELSRDVARRQVFSGSKHAFRAVPSFWHSMVEDAPEVAWDQACALARQSSYVRWRERKDQEWELKTAAKTGNETEPEVVVAPSWEPARRLCSNTSTRTRRWTRLLTRARKVAGQTYIDIGQATERGQIGVCARAVVAAAEQPSAPPRYLASGCFETEYEVYTTDELQRAVEATLARAGATLSARDMPRPARWWTDARTGNG